MATYTSYLNLEKPTTSETFNLLKLNQNWDKIDAGVSALNSNMAKAIVTYTYSYSINGNDNLSITAGQMGMDNPPTGYNPVAVAFYNTGTPNVIVRGINVVEKIAANNCIWLHNLVGSNQSGTMTIGVLNLKI